MVVVAAAAAAVVVVTAAVVEVVNPLIPTGQDSDGQFEH